MIVLAGILFVLVANPFNNNSANGNNSTSASNNTFICNIVGNAIQSSTNSNFILFNLSLTNSGSSAVTVTKTDIKIHLPSTTYLNSGFTVSQAGNNVTSSGFQVSAGSSIDISIQVNFGSYPTGSQGDFVVIMNISSLGSKTFTFSGKAP